MPVDEEGKVTMAAVAIAKPLREAVRWMASEGQRQFDELRPELCARAAELVSAMAEPRPTPAELVETTWRVMAGRRKQDMSRKTVMRELACVAQNLLIHDRLRSNDLEGAFRILRPQLTAWANNLVHGLSRRPDPDDIVQKAQLKLYAAPTFRIVDNPLGYAFRTVKNLVIDEIRNPPELPKPTGHDRVEQDTSPERLEEIATRAGLSAEERCMVFRVVFEGLSVTAAQECCGGPPGAPFFVFDKILDKLAASFGISRPRARRNPNREGKR